MNTFLSIGLRNLSVSTVRLNNLRVQRFSEKAWKDKEVSAEKQYFNQEDEKAMRNLLKKLHQHTSTRTAGTDTEKNEDVSKLKTILNRYKVQYNEAIISEIYNWKYD